MTQKTQKTHILPVVIEGALSAPRAATHTFCGLSATDIGYVWYSPSVLDRFTGKMATKICLRCARAAARL